jgi:hypothetical protein
MCLIEKDTFKEDDNMYQQDDNDILHTPDEITIRNNINDILHTIDNVDTIIDDYDIFIEDIPGHALIGASNIHTVIVAISLYVYFICFYSIIHNLIM